MKNERHALEYCVVRVVPDIERAEFLNAGVILVSRAIRFLDARVELRLDYLRSLAPALPPDELSLIEEHLAMIPKVCAGESAAGPVARMPLGQRWHWLTAASSTIVQPGPVHTGLSADPPRDLERLFQRLVRGERALTT